MKRKSIAILAGAIIAIAGFVLAALHFRWFSGRGSSFETQIRDAWNQAADSGKNPIPGSQSPDGKWHVVQFGYGPLTSDECMVLASDSHAFVGILPIGGESDYRPGKRYHHGSTLLWTPDSRLLAVHDSKPKHSRVQIFRRAEGSVIEVPVDDLRVVAEARVKRAGGECLSSGQYLQRWKENDLLEVEVRMKFAAENRSALILVRVGDASAEALSPVD